MRQGILTSQVSNAKCEVFYGRGSSLAMNEVSVDQRILQQRCHCIDVILAHLTYVFEHKGKTLQDTILDVHFGDTVLVHQRWQDCEGSTSFSHDSDCYGSTNSVLAFLNPQIIQKGGEDVLWTNCLRNVAESVYRRPPDALLVSF